MATAAERLVEAEAAYHSLQTGKSVVRVQDSSGDSVTYHSGNIRDLRRYIADLKAEITGDNSRVCKPLKPRFHI